MMFYTCQKLLQVFVVGDDSIMDDNKLCKEIKSSLQNQNTSIQNIYIFLQIGKFVKVNMRYEKQVVGNRPLFLSDLCGWLLTGLGTP